MLPVDERRGLKADCYSGLQIKKRVRSMNTKARINLLICGIGVCVCAAFSGTPGKVMVNADQRKWTISEHLLGLHVEYSNEADALYEDGRLIAWMASNRVSNIRYPGGSTTKYWNWKNPTGGFAMDRNDPKYGGDVAPPEEWMSLEEYFDIVDAIGGVSPSGSQPLRTLYVRQY